MYILVTLFTYFVQMIILDFLCNIFYKSDMYKNM